MGSLFFRSEWPSYSVVNENTDWSGYSGWENGMRDIENSCEGLYLKHQIVLALSFSFKTEGTEGNVWTLLQTILTRHKAPNPGTYLFHNWVLKFLQSGKATKWITEFANRDFMRQTDRQADTETRQWAVLCYFLLFTSSGPTERTPVMGVHCAAHWIS